jgi:hypothetical protein
LVYSRENNGAAFGFYSRENIGAAFGPHLPNRPNQGKNPAGGNPSRIGTRWGPTPGTGNICNKQGASVTIPPPTAARRPKLTAAQTARIHNPETSAALYIRDRRGPSAGVTSDSGRRKCPAGGAPFALALRLGRSPWAFAPAIRPGRSPWPSALAVRPGCSPWPSALAFCLHPAPVPVKMRHRITEHPLKLARDFSFFCPVLACYFQLLSLS